MNFVTKSVLMLLSVTLLFTASVSFLSVSAQDLQISPGENGGTSIKAETVIVTKPKFSISVPTGIPLGNISKTEESSVKSATFTVSVSNLEDLGEKQIRVLLSTPYEAFCMWSGDHVLPYQIFSEEQAGEPIAIGGVFYTFTQAQTVTGRVEVDQMDIPAEGSYGGILHFIFRIEDKPTE